MIHEIEKKVWAEEGVRSRCDLSVAYQWRSGQGGQRTLQVTVWIPAVAWSAGTAEQVVSTVSKTLSATPGHFNMNYFKSIKMTATTGNTYLHYSYFIWIVLTPP